MPYNQLVKNKAFTLVLVLLALAGFLSPGAAPQAKKRTAKDLPPQFRKWLEEEVVYIITAKEKEVFLQLDSDRDRTIFTEAFWKQRDPSPDTPQNEFKIEHYRRITYANLWHGRDTPGAGWRTDMGRVYIILGEPKSTEKHENLYDHKPTIIWFYEGMAEYGLPGSFSVVFFKRDINTSYRLYSPIADGPGSLMIHFDGDPANAQQAYTALMQIEPSVADVSISLIPGESRYSLAPSLASEILLRQRIPAAPFEKIKDDYADKLLLYKGIIEVDYSANYIQSDAFVDVFQDSSGLSFVHYLIEPQRLTLEESERQYRADLIVNGKVTDRQGRTVYQFERSVPLRLNEAQFKQIRPLPFSFQDLFPLVPGQYKLNILWKNGVSKEFSSVEADLVVPAPAAFSMSQPVLAYKIDRESRYRGTNKPFLVGGVQYVPTPRGVFLPSDTMYVYFQVRNPPGALRTNGRIEYTIFKDAMQVATRTRTIAGAPGGADFSEEFPLTGYGYANYLLNISALDADGTVRLSSKVPFGVTSIVSIRRPWVISLPLPSADDPSMAHVLGKQYFQTGDASRARPLLEASYRRESGNLSYALDYAQFLFSAGEYGEIPSIAKPFLDDDRKFEFLKLLGDTSRSLGKYAEAVAFYKDDLAHFGTNIAVLNAIGECWARLGDVPQALAAYERSLELDPKQEGIRALVKTLRDKK